jgi:hypothetical protein
MPRRVLSWFWRNKRRFAFALLTLAALWVATNVYASFALNREMNAIRERGEPLSFTELITPVPTMKMQPYFTSRLTAS